LTDTPELKKRLRALFLFLIANKQSEKSAAGTMKFFD